jgi:hypothetical protein
MVACARWLVPRSPLYNASIEHSHQTRFLAMVADNRAGTVPEIAKLDALYNGCTTAKSEQIKISVGFARYFLFTTSDIQRAAYLMNDKNNFIHLERWSPKSELTYLEVFVTESTEWKRVNVNVIIKASYFLAKAGSSPEGAQLMDLVVNPTVKKVLMNFQELHEIMTSAGDSVSMKNILRNVLLEMFASKLGTTITIDMTEQDIAEMDLQHVSVEMKAKVRKLILAHCSKTYGMYVLIIIFHDRVPLSAILSTFSFFKQLRIYFAFNFQHHLNAK